MSLDSIDSMKARYGYDKLSEWGIGGTTTEKRGHLYHQPDNQDPDLRYTSSDRVDVRGKYSQVYANPLLRLREDKLRSLKSALYNSYQSAVIQFDKDDRVVNSTTGVKSGYHFRCLINHDKLKVDYEDKVLSIPYREIPVELEGNRQLSLAQKIVDTGTPGLFLDEAGFPVLDDNDQEIYEYRVKPGDTFKWISGNEGYMPDSYWIIYLQYSEETAYFRGEIRKADDIIEIIPIEEDGSEGDPLYYHGWTVGPNEDEEIWNVKKGVVWNDMYYTKLLFITKDEYTTAFFKRFDRVVINGQTWEIAGYNDNYGTTSKNSTGGLIRVALKQTYTSTNEVIKRMDEEHQASTGEIFGPTVVNSFDVATYYVTTGTGSWSISSGAPVSIISQGEMKIKLQVNEVNTSTSFEIHFGSQSLTVNVKPFK